MTTLLLLLTLFGAAATPVPARGVIDATITGTAEPLEATLMMRHDDGDWQLVAEKILPPRARRVRFDKLPGGVYQLLLRGPAPTEQLATKLVIGDADVRRAVIRIEPAQFSGKVTLGGGDLGAGALMLEHKDFHWRAVITFAPDGTFTVPMWQRGSYKYSVRAAAMATTHLGDADLESGNPLRLLVDIPDGRMSGTVRDAATNAPVGGATITLRSQLAREERTTVARADADGRFDLVGMPYGSHTVTVTTPTHLEATQAAFELSSASRFREVNVRVDAGKSVPIVVIDSDSDPVANAAVLTVAGGRVCARTTTDEDGLASVSVPANEAATLFIVARDSAFGVLRLDSRPVEARQRVYLPRASSSLLIRAVKSDGAPMPPFSLLMRYNGELLPPAVTDELEIVQGLALGTGKGSEALLQKIPSGAYEFWPYRTEDERDAIIASGSTFAAPIQVNVRTGENKIEVKFAAR